MVQAGFMHFLGFVPFSLPQERLLRVQVLPLRGSQPGTGHRAGDWEQTMNSGLHGGVPAFLGLTSIFGENENYCKWREENINNLYCVHQM